MKCILVSIIPIDVSWPEENRHPCFSNSQQAMTPMPMRQTPLPFYCTEIAIAIAFVPPTRSILVISDVLLVQTRHVTILRTRHPLGHNSSISCRTFLSRWPVRPDPPDAHVDPWIWPHRHGPPWPHWGRPVHERPRQ